MSKNRAIFLLSMAIALFFYTQKNTNALTSLLPVDYGIGDTEITDCGSYPNGECDVKGIEFTIGENDIIINRAILSISNSISSGIALVYLTDQGGNIQGTCQTVYLTEYKYCDFDGQLLKAGETYRLYGIGDEGAAYQYVQVDTVSVFPATIGDITFNGGYGWQTGLTTDYTFIFYGIEYSNPINITGTITTTPDETTKDFWNFQTQLTLLGTAYSSG